MGTTKTTKHLNDLLARLARTTDRKARTAKERTAAAIVKVLVARDGARLVAMACPALFGFIRPAAMFARLAGVQAYDLEAMAVGQEMADLLCLG